MSTRRIYPSPVIKETSKVIVSREASTNQIVNSALQLLSGQIEVLRVKSSMGATLEDSEIKNLRMLIQSLVDLRKDERDQEKHDDVTEKIKNMTDEELVQYIESVKSKEKA